MFKITQNCKGCKHRLSRAFTLTELMVAVLLAAILMIGVNSVFSVVTKTVGQGQATAQCMREFRGFHATIGGDFSNMVGAGDTPGLVINSSHIWCYEAGTSGYDRSGSGQLTYAPYTYGFASPFATVAAGSSLKAPECDDFSHRADVLCYFIGTNMQRQTGQIGYWSAYGANHADPSIFGPTLQARFHGNQAFVSIGHALRVDHFGNVSMPGTTTNAGNGDSNLLTSQDAARKWDLARSVVLLAKPNTGTVNNGWIQDAYGNKMEYQTPPTPSFTTFATLSAISPPKVANELQSLANGAGYGATIPGPTPVALYNPPNVYMITLPVVKTSPSGVSYTVNVNLACDPSGNPAATMQPVGPLTYAASTNYWGGRPNWAMVCDLAGIDAATLRSNIMADETNQIYANYPSSQWANGFVITNPTTTPVWSCSGLSYRFMTAATGRPTDQWAGGHAGGMGVSGLNGGASDWIDATGQTSNLLISGCSQFIVEFAGDYVTQDASGMVTANQPDGNLDFQVDENGVRNIRWYGAPRDVDGSGRLDVSPGTSAVSHGVLPVNACLLPSGSPPPDQVAAASSAMAYRFEKSGIAALPAGGWMNATGGVGGNITYVCGWSGNEASIAAKNATSGVTQYYNLFPKLLRLTVRVDDVDGRLSKGHTLEFIYPVAK